MNDHFIELGMCAIAQGFIDPIILDKRVHITLRDYLRIKEIANESA